MASETWRRTLLASASATALMLGAVSDVGAGSLRDRNSSASAAAAATAAAQAGAQAAAAAASQAMTRVNVSLQAMRNQQAAARAAAQAAVSNVPNGLVPGGLVVAPGAVSSATNFGNGLWQGANLPTQRPLANGRTQVEVKQNEQKAILTWQSFNVGRETDLYFNQSAGGGNVGNWIALNRVLDASASPSRILGTIKAEGQVYVINRNGIIFGGASQVNVGTLVASSLSLSNEQFQVGINTAVQLHNYMFIPQFGDHNPLAPDALQSATASGQVPRFTPGAPPGEVRVEAGAQLSADTGGKVMLFAPHVANGGRLSAPDGQVIMAAGEQIWLMTDLTGVRGLDVTTSAPMPWLMNYDVLNSAIKGTDPFAQKPFVDSIKDTILPEMYARAAAVGYRVTNTGEIVAERGNITLQGREVMQAGVALATTAMNNRDGSIRLRAVGQGMRSKNANVDEFYNWVGGELHLAPGSVTAALPDLSDTSTIERTSLGERYKAGSIRLDGQLVDIQSRASVVAPAGSITVVASASGVSSAARDGSRIYVGEDAYVSVAGLKDISLAMDRNLVEVDLRINELRDSPLLRESWLRGQKVIVDRRAKGTFVNGPMAGVQWVQDKDGNTIPGAWVGTPLADASAWIGTGKTDLAEQSTKGGSIIIRSGGALITRPGSMLDVSGGSVRYSDGLINTTKLLGADGRVYDISEATPDREYVSVAGQFSRVHRDERGEVRFVETWTNQLRAGRRAEPGYTEGRDAGSIQLHVGEAIILEGSYWGGTVVGERQAATGNPATAGTLTFGGNNDPDRSWLIGSLTISNDPVLLPSSFTANTPVDPYWYAGVPGNDNSYRLRMTHLDADVLRESGLGNITLYVSTDFTLKEGTLLELTPGSSFTVAANTGINFTQRFQVDGVIRAPGGSVAFREAETLAIGAGARIDVSGQWVSVPGALPPVVHGGSIDLMNAEFQPGAVLDVSGGGWYQAVGSRSSLKVGNAGEIVLFGVDASDLTSIDMRGYAAGSGGTLRVTTQSSVQIGGSHSADPDLAYLPETLFGDRGFRSVTINTAGRITVAAGAHIKVLPLSVDLQGVNFPAFGTGTTIDKIGRFAEAPLARRMDLEPTSLTLNGEGIVVEAGSSIETDPRGTIILKTPESSSEGIVIAGRLEAPAGTITLSSGSAITIKEMAVLAALGLPAIEADGHGFRSGTVLGGGSVGIDTDSVTIERGSVIDVSGASGEIDLPQGDPSRVGRYAPVALVSNGGAISVRGEGLVEGTWRGHAGGSGARGGAVSLSTRTNPATLSETAGTGSGLLVRPSTFQSGGFADLSFLSSVRLENVDLAMSGSIAFAGAIMNVGGTSSRLAAPYISVNAPASGVTRRPGTLTLSASLIDLQQVTIDSYEQVVLEASDIRFLIRNQTQQPHLDVRGVLVLRAGQIYPDSQTTAIVKSTEKIIVEQRGIAGSALSVGGMLTLEAPVIEQGGTLRAPFGQIVLKASDRLTLGAGSVTSVSGDGLILPYGSLSNNEHWMVTAPGQTEAQSITTLPEKRITLDAPTVELAAGSVVDIRGGGDLHAAEHVPGPGGSYDILTRPGVYAVIPAYNGSVTPGGTTRAGDRVWLDGGNGLTAGWYTLLPARYALLPGAYLVQMVSGSQGGAPFSAAAGADGSVYMTGYRGNAYDSSHDQQRSSWRVMSGDVVRRYSEYNEALANTFFASDAFRLTQYRQTGETIVTPRLPMDGGSVVFKATADLILKGQLQSQAAAGGRGGLVDVAAGKIAILGPAQDATALRADGYLVIDAVNLSGFGAGSLLLGGIRTGDTRGLRLDVTASDIVVRNDSSSALTGAEVILAASESIEIGAGSMIAARGEAPRGAGDLIIAPQAPQSTSNNGTPNDPNDDFVVPSKDWGALIRVANGDVVRVRRENVDTSVGGRVTIGAGAVLDGGEALLIDATNNASVAQARLSGRSLSVASGRIGFGGGSGLVIDTAALAALRNTQHLTLRSYSTFDFHTAVDLTGLAAVTFDAAALVGYGSSDVTVVGNRLVLENTAANFTEPAGTGNGRLTLVAGELVFGQGAKALRGFDTVTFSGTDRIVGEGNGSLDAGGAALTLASPLMTGRGGAGQSVKTTGTLTVVGTGAAPARDEQSLGARWTLTGRSIDFGGRINALGGSVELAATQGNVVVGAGAVIDVGGFGKPFFDLAEYTDAGRIALSAAGGSVLIRPGSVLDLAAHPSGGGGGALEVASDGGDVVLDGTIRAQVAAGQRGASFSLDISTLADFAGFNQHLNEGGFSESRDFRIRSGSVTVDGVTTVRKFRLVADSGSVTIAGTVDARSTYGGEIAIYAGNGLTVTSTAVLRAGATDTVDNLGSGRITLGVTGGTLAVQGGLIDVSGGEGGKVTLRAPLIEQTGPDTVNVTFAGTIAGAREIVLEGFKRFNLADLAANPNYVGVTINGDGQAELDLAAKATGKLNVLADYGAGTLVEFVRDFDVSAAYGNLGGLAGQANFHARPGMELDHTGDIVLKSNWNLGAGIVDEAGAHAAGVMGYIPVLDKYYLTAGRAGDLLRDHTTMVYRTGGSVLGEPGTLTLRAGGDLILKGSITDGFFQFADPLDPQYLTAKGTRTIEQTVTYNGGRTPGTAVLTVFDPNSTSTPTAYAGLTFTEPGLLRQTVISEPAAIGQVPYSAEANSPAAGTGNALAYAVLFPAITKADSSKVAVSSWSQTLVAGAAPSGESADPARLAAGSIGRIILSEQPTYNYIDSQVTLVGKTYIDGNINLNVGGKPQLADGTKNPNDWLAFLETSLAYGTSTANGLKDNSSFVLSVGVPSDVADSIVLGWWQEYATARGFTERNQYRYRSLAAGSEQRLYVIMKYSTFKEFYNDSLAAKLNSSLAELYSPFPPGSSGGTVYPTTMVRTGTGDITTASRGDLQLKGGASIYTAGHQDLAAVDNFTTAPASAVYAVGGGHVRVSAGGNIDAALPTDPARSQHYTEWLKRQGAMDVFGSTPTEQGSWWVDFVNFQSGIGTLGGGNVAVGAGGDLNNLTIALATNGRVAGGRALGEPKLLTLRNGGAMTVEASGGVNGGYYYVGRGAGTIEASEFAVGRDLRIPIGQSFLTFPMAPIVSVGDATLDVRTAGDLRLQTALDPLLVFRSRPYESAYMISQTDRAALSLASTGGDLILVGQTGYLSNGNHNNEFAGRLYPSKLRLSALNGSVLNQGAIYMLPGSSPELRILAGQDVLTGVILMSRANPDILPTPLWPSMALLQIGSPFQKLLWNEVGAWDPIVAGWKIARGNPAQLLNANDFEPSRIYALNGSITSSLGGMGFSDNIAVPPAVVMSEQTWFRAGLDIRNIDYELRNVHPTDVSLIEAGNDIIGGPLQTLTGPLVRTPQIRIQGPGALVLSAGRDVYSPTLRLYSTGNRRYNDDNNRPMDLTTVFGLPEQGASITVMAGLNGKAPDYDALAAAYLDPANLASMPDYLKATVVQGGGPLFTSLPFKPASGTVVPLYFLDIWEARSETRTHRNNRGLVGFVMEMTGGPVTSFEDAWTTFKSFPAQTQHVFLRRIYMQELREAGKNQNEPGINGLPKNGGYNRGYAAIETLFPGTDWKGDVTMGNALFRTMQGGDIDVLTPGGGLQVAALGTNVAKGFGLVTLGYGDINIFARDNVTVNRSRVLTFAGGDEIIWSSLGDIDAGRGAKTARVPSAPEIQTDADAVTRVLEKADMTGSGIGTIIGFTGVTEGDVHLIAPLGTVNAGDAGVRVSGNLNLAARFVLNIGNFDVAGEVKGLPKQEVKSAPLSIETKDKAAADAVRDVTQQAMPTERPSVIIVEILGYGGGESEKDERKPRDERSSYDPAGAVQVVGYGQLTAAQARQLTEEERRGMGR